MFGYQCSAAEPPLNYADNSGKTLPNAAIIGERRPVVVKLLPRAISDTPKTIPL